MLIKPYCDCLNMLTAMLPPGFPSQENKVWNMILPQGFSSVCHCLPQKLSICLSKSLQTEIECDWRIKYETKYMPIIPSWWRSKYVCCKDQCGRNWQLFQVFSSRIIISFYFFHQMLWTIGLGRHLCHH